MVTKWQNKLQLRNAFSCFYPSGSFGQRLCSVKLQVRNTLAIDGRNNQNQNQPNYPAKSHIKASNGPNRPNPSVRVTFCSRRHERSCLCMKLQCRQGFIMMETMKNSIQSARKSVSGWSQQWFNTLNQFWYIYFENVTGRIMLLISHVFT